MSLPVLQRQSSHTGHTHCVTTLTALDPKDASAVIACGKVLARPVRGLFGQVLCEIPISGHSRVYFVGSQVYLQVGDKMSVRPNLRPDPERVANNLRLGLPADDLLTDTVLFPYLVKQGEQTQYGEWYLDRVETTYEQMLELATVALLPKVLSVAGAKPEALSCPIYLGGYELLNGPINQPFTATTSSEKDTGYRPSVLR
jgi:hypothetical protein